MFKIDSLRNSTTTLCRYASVYTSLQLMLCDRLASNLDFRRSSMLAVKPSLTVDDRSHWTNFRCLVATRPSPSRVFRTGSEVAEGKRVCLVTSAGLCEMLKERGLGDPTERTTIQVRRVTELAGRPQASRRTAVERCSARMARVQSTPCLMEELVDATVHEYAKASARAIYFTMKLNDKTNRIR